LGLPEISSNRVILIKKLEMLGKAFDRFLGARDLDWNFAKHIFKKKHGWIPSQTLRASSSSYQL
jgi:hypothetical protein